MAFISEQEKQQIAAWDKFLLIDKVNQLAERVAKLEGGKAKTPAAPKAPTPTKK